MLSLKLTKFSYFYSFEIVGRGSETQFQMGEILNQLT